MSSQASPFFMFIHFHIHSFIQELKKIEWAHLRKFVCWARFRQLKRNGRNNNNKNELERRDKWNGDKGIRCHRPSFVCFFCVAFLCFLALAQKQYFLYSNPLTCRARTLLQPLVGDRFWDTKALTFSFPFVVLFYFMFWLVGKMCMPTLPFFHVWWTEK